MKNYIEKGYKLICDPDFGYLRAEPIPSKEDIVEYYRDKYFSEEKTKGGGNPNTSSLQLQEAQSYYTNSRWDNILFHLNKYFSNDLQNRELLDIGCGFSQALLFFRKKGLSVKGIEASEQGVEYAREQKLNVVQGIAEDIDKLGLEKFDIITLFEVLEHLREPAKLLQYINRELLNTNGILVIDVPNEFNDFQVIANKVCELNDWWITPPEHINYFSKDSLVAVLEKCGYRIFHTEASFPMELFMLMGDVYVGNGQIGQSCHEKRVMFERLMRENGKENKLRNLYTSLADLNLGRTITVYATRGND